MLHPLAELAPDGRTARRLIRSGAHTGHTAGMAPGHVQGNLAILPRAQADDFLRFCQRNPKPCPLLAVSEPGDPFLPTLGEDVDIRHDVPRYRVWRDGVAVDEPTDIGALWREDLVSFVIGCSFTFETALLQAGVPLRHVAQGRNVAMFRTDIPTAAAGPFHGPLVVSMRPLKAPDAIRAVQVTSRFPGAHGAPVHLGDPGRIGIADVLQPDWGDAVDIADGELPVFWACGVTPQAVVEAARLPFCITHAPGHMLVTDWRDHQLAVL
ncbi:putative hydro-lyase [Pseudorhodoferax sp. LjRoot39]|uniref:putative hydro-lyase n=1 Tax=Pseudorhodoferax sp. LjRoot39 TaxID=3342328 RepID=UPI003ECD8257